MTHSFKMTSFIMILSATMLLQGGSANAYVVDVNLFLPQIGLGYWDGGLGDRDGMFVVVDPLPESGLYKGAQLELNRFQRGSLIRMNTGRRLDASSSRLPFLETPLSQRDNGFRFEVNQYLPGIGLGYWDGGLGDRDGMFVIVDPLPQSGLRKGMQLELNRIQRGAIIRMKALRPLNSCATVLAS